jgi:hypothetical protein
MQSGNCSDGYTAEVDGLARLQSTAVSCKTTRGEPGCDDERGLLGERATPEIEIVGMLVVREENRVDGCGLFGAHDSIVGLRQHP